MPEEKPEEKADLVQQMAASENWGQGGDFVLDPATGMRKPAATVATEVASSPAAADELVAKTPTSKKG